MMIEDAWAKLEPPCCSSPTCVDRRRAVRAGFLAVHVDACLWRMDDDGMESLVTGRDCGDGWLCDRAKEIQKLGTGR